MAGYFFDLGDGKEGKGSAHIFCLPLGFETWSAHRGTKPDFLVCDSPSRTSRPSPLTVLPLFTTFHYRGSADAWWGVVSQMVEHAGVAG